MFMPAVMTQSAHLGMTSAFVDNAQDRASTISTGHDVREQLRFDDAIGIFPEFSSTATACSSAHYRALLALPYLARVPRCVGIFWLQEGASRHKFPHASARP